MTDHPDPLANLRGFAAFSKRSYSDQIAERLRNPHSEMAANALYKARAALAADPARAERYVDLALRLPYDEIERQAPAAWEAHMMLYTLVGDAADDSDQDDVAWLDAAVDAMAASDPAGRAEMRIVLDTIADEFELPDREQRAVRQAVGGVEPAPTLYDGDFPVELLKERIIAVLALCERYEDALDEYYG